MKHRYPYASRNRKELKKLRRDQDYMIWQRPDLDLQRIVAGLQKPFVEIGGPTEDGFYFLDGLDLNTEPIITNITDNPLPYAKNAKQLAAKVKEILDARAMPYEDGSIGIFLMSGMSITSDWYVELPEDEYAKVGSRVDKEFDIAKLEMDQVALGTLAPDKVKYAQRIPMYREVYRSLCDGGLFFSDGGVEELCILQRLGFTLLAYTQEQIRAEQGWTGIFYEFVVRK
jgi:hypothetical protein